MIKVMSVFGTRPEAIKMCPLIGELEKNPDIENLVCLTGQHREMLRQVMDIFGTTARYNLDIMQPGQTLTEVTSLVLSGMEDVLSMEKPDMVLVHGDTNTSFAAALAAFYQQIPVGHVEAGLRTYNKYSPFPEEMNRCLTGKIASLHFAPTEKNRRNLAGENITENVFVTGNTVIDAFHTTIRERYIFKDNLLRQIDFTGKRMILMTAHRRENLGQPLADICGAVKRLVQDYRDIRVVYPVHMNPAVRDIVLPILEHTDRVHLLSPLDVEDMHNLMARSFLVITDSGGLQEEAPACGKPVLVLRRETERPEAVEAGTVKVIGVSGEAVYHETARLLTDINEYNRMAKAVNPYGDGHASERIVGHILDWEKNNHGRSLADR